MNYPGYAHHYPARVLNCRWQGHEALVECLDNTGAPLRFSLGFFAPGRLRVRLWTDTFTPPAFPVVDETALRPLALYPVEDPDAFRMGFGGHRLELYKDPFDLRVLNGAGQVVCRQSLRDVDSVAEGQNRVPPLGYSCGENGTPAGMNIGMVLRGDEHIYGLGERFTAFDKAGQRVTMRNFDTLGCRGSSSYINIPFYISSYGYGLFVHSHEIFDFNIGAESLATVSLHTPPPALEYYLIFGDSPKAILSDYVALTGPAARPPDWSFGLWHSNGFKGSSRADVEADAARYEKEDIPLSVMHFDCYWMRDDHWCDFVWDSALYPDHRRMLADLKARGLKVCLWINPYLTVVTELYTEGREKGYFVKNAAGEPYQADLWHGLLPMCVMVDFTNPEAAAWYAEKVAAALGDGADTLKTDFGEDIPEDAVFANGMTGRQMRNVYSRLYNKVVYEAIARQSGTENAMVWARSGCAGMQQFPV
ncbi:hypothetical protein LJC60_11265, partial [Ruminococcaceae bacterium OttesenSCG-928-D13]|nr:hypothetical protein [Ruminococcaceae bacterium OttesenSCG-928-D13]